jgi:hypothetical protein
MISGYLRILCIHLAPSRYGCWLSRITKIHPNGTPKEKHKEELTTRKTRKIIAPNASEENVIGVIKRFKIIAIDSRRKRFSDSI